MRYWSTVLVLIFLRLVVVSTWSFSNILQSVQTLINPGDQLARVLSYTQDDDVNSTSNEVTVLGRIIMAPLRKKVCEPGERMDRRHRCRKIW